MLAAKMDYHNMCRQEKSTAHQENNYRGDPSVSADQVRQRCRISPAGGLFFTNLSSVLLSCILLETGMLKDIPILKEFHNCRHMVTFSIKLSTISNWGLARDQKNDS